MSIVPEYNESVQTEGPQQESLSITPRGAESSGENIAQAAQGIGKEAEAIGSQVTRHLLYMQRQKDAIELQNRLLQADTLMQNGHAALFNRRGAQAIGISGGSAQNPDQQARSLALGTSSLSEDAQARLDPSFIKFDNSSAGLIAKARDVVIHGVDGKSSLPADVAKQALSRFDRMAESYHGRAVNHEAEQIQIAHVDSLNNSFAASVNAASVAASPKAFIPLLEDAQKDALEVARIKGQDINDKDTRAAVMQSAAKEATAKYLHANIEDHPERSQEVLNAAKPLMHPADAGDLQKSIDGKMIDMRDEQIWKNVTADPRSRNADGTFNLAAVEGYAKDLSKNRPEKEQLHHAEQAKSQAIMANGALKQGWDEAAKGFLDSIQTQRLKNPNMLYQDAEKDAISQFAGSVQPGTLEKLKDSAAKTWLGDSDGPQMRLKLALSNPDLKRGYEDAKTMIDATYPGKAQVEQKKLAIQNLDAIAPQFKSGKSITDWQTDQFSKVKVPGSVFGMHWLSSAKKGEESDWQRQALGDQASVDAAYTSLQNRLGRAPSTAEMHEAIAEYKSKLKAYQDAHQTQ